MIAGSLPAGMQVTSTGLLTGTPAEVAKRTLYTFVVRATAGTTITDRTFSIDVKGADHPHSQQHLDNYKWKIPQELDCIGLLTDQN